MTNAEVIEHVTRTNDPLYNLAKIAEECGELNLVLLQRLTKGLTAVSNDEIMREIADVQIRLQMAKEIFGEEQINKFIQEKIDKYRNYIERGLYVGKI